MTAILTDEGQADQNQILQAAIAANLRVGLYTANAGAGRVVQLSDITAATFSGYAAQTPAFAAAVFDAADRSKGVAPTLTFTHSGGGTPNTVKGYYVWNSSTGRVYFYEDFGAPVSMSAAGQHIDVQCNWYYGVLTPPL